MEGIWVSLEECNREQFRDFCKSWSQIAEVRPSEPPGALGVPGLVEFFLEIGAPSIAEGLFWLAQFLLHWRHQNAGNIVSIRVGGEKIRIKGRDIREIEIDIERLDKKIRSK
jgi:hypothetical protein